MDDVSDVAVSIERVRVPRTARVGAQALARDVERELDALLRLAPLPALAAGGAPLTIALDATVRIRGAVTARGIARALALQVHRRLAAAAPAAGGDGSGSTA